MGAELSKETLDLAKKALGTPDDQIKKAITQATGLVAYNLEAPSKKLFPVLTPLRNKIPRKGGGVGTAVNWKAVTKINSTNQSAGVSEGNRGAVISTVASSLVATYAGLGLEDNVTFEAEYAGRTFEDAKALAVMDLLSALMLQEEMIVLGGNSSTGLGTPTTPTLATSTTGGAIATGLTISVIVIALTLEGWLNSSVANGVPVGPVTKTNADGTTDAIGGGGSQKSANATVVTGAGSTNSVTATVPLVKGAVAYAWYMGSGAGNERISQITTINSVLFTAVPGSGQLASAQPASDQSKNTLIFDGLLPQTVGAGALTSYLVGQGGMTLFQGSTGGLVGQMATGTAGTGTGLTADNKGGIVEIDAMLRAFWDISRISPKTIWVSSQEAQNMATKVLTATSSGVTRMINTTVDGITGGIYLKSYYNKFGMGQGQVIDINIHPNLPPGTIFFETETLPYKLNNVPSVLQMDIRQEYYQLEWALKTRKYEYGVYVDEVLKHYFPPAFGIITNIANA